jgi:hypothetical protein
VKKKESSDPTVHIAKAPPDWTVQEVLLALQLDPFQSRVSKHPIRLMHPRTGRQKVLKEYTEDILDDSRLAIQAQDSIIFVSRLTNSTIGTIFKAMNVFSLSEIDKIFGTQDGQ